MDPNPYKPPVAVEAPLGKSQQSEVYVEGKFLVVPSGTVLPPCCVKTNQKITEQEMRRQTFHWCPLWVALSILLNVCVLVVLYFVLRKRCELVFGIHPTVRARFRRRATIKALVTVISFVGMIAGAAIDSDNLLGIAGVLFVFALLSNFLDRCPISIAKHRKGLFWIRGCCPEFLAQFNGGYGPQMKQKGWQ